MSGKKYLSRFIKDNESIFIKDIEAREAVQYEDVYIGAASESSVVIVPACHHTSVMKGRPVSITAESNYIWLVLPSLSDTPMLLMGGLEVPMASDSTIMVEGNSYKVLRSSNTYNGTFSVCLF